MHRLLLFISIFILAFASCKKCTRYTYGYIIDRETSKPIKGVEIRSHAALDDRSRDHRVTYTDSTGWFETAFELDGVAKCGNLKLIISDSNYHTAYETNLPAGDTIILYRIKK